MTRGVVKNVTAGLYRLGRYSLGDYKTNFNLPRHFSRKNVALQNQMRRGTDLN